MSQIKSNITSNTVIMNLRLIPDNMSIEEVLQIADEHKILFYDSKLTDEKPRIINENADMDKILLDISSLEGKAKYNEIIKLKQQDNGEKVN